MAEWLHLSTREILVKSLVTAVMTLVLILAIFYGIIAGPSQRERQQTARNVARLVDESRLNRELLCLVALRDPSNPAWANQRITELCLEVGVRP